MKTFNFQVNLEGIIDILANHLYSEEKIFIRELLQNATDAITARKKINPNFEGKIRVDVIDGDATTPAQIVFEDNGIGLTKEEVHQFLSSIGSSIKRKTNKLAQNRADFIGQFGIGLLSCFMVTDEIVMVTRSVKSEEVLEWRGNMDGSYQLKSLKINIEPGTRVYLRCKTGTEAFYKKDRLKELMRHYGNLLPFSILYGDKEEMINDGYAPFEEATISKEALMAYGKKELKMDCFDCIPINCSTVKGVAYILPYAPSPTAKSSHKVYLKRMLISEKAENILPPWAFFVKCILNSNALRPTASRESFYEDEYLETTRKELANCLKEYLVQLSKNEPERLHQLLRIHHDSIKSLALHDDDFFKLIIPFLSFKSTIGYVTLPEYERTSAEVMHVADIDEFKQIASVANAQRLAVINSGYIYDAQLLTKYGQLFSDKKVTRINAEKFIQHFEDLSPEENIAIEAFLDFANSVLQEFQCKAVVKKFAPKNVPTLYYMDSEMNFLRTAKKTKEISNQMWGEIVGIISESVQYKTTSQLCFNYYHPLVQKMVKNKQVAANELPIKVLYVQALLLGHHPLNTKELNILSEGLLEIMMQ